MAKVKEVWEVKSMLEESGVGGRRGDVLGKRCGETGVVGMGAAQEVDNFLNGGGNFGVG